MGITIWTAVFSVDSPGGIGVPHIGQIITRRSSVLGPSVRSVETWNIVNRYGRTGQTA